MSTNPTAAAAEEDQQQQLDLRGILTNFITKNLLLLFQSVSVCANPFQSVSFQFNLFRSTCFNLFLSVLICFNPFQSVSIRFNLQSLSPYSVDGDLEGNTELENFQTEGIL